MFLSFERFKGMGLYLKTLVLVFLKFSINNGEDLCPPSFCGNSMLKVEHPFKLESQTPTNNCTYFNLYCNKTTNRTIVSLPYGGDFYVSNIDYVEGYIQLNDPENCLMKRIMNFSLEFSPLKARYYENYTFYVCPSDSKILEYLNPIDCLSNSTNKMIATFEYAGDLEFFNCGLIGSWLLPVQYYGSYDASSLFLTWNVTVCEACLDVHDDHPPPPRDSGQKTTAKVVAIAMSMPALILMALSCCSIFCLHLVKMIAKKFEGDSEAAAAAMVAPQTTVATAVPPPSTTSNTGLDKTKIAACTELVVLSACDQGIPSANSNTCSICLENYGNKEKISVISKCGHCFHASCIQQWLGRNGSCPVCRTSLSGGAL